jgi:hypothetical protein
MASRSVGAVLMAKGVRMAVGPMSFDDYISMKGGGGIVLELVEDVLVERFGEAWYEMSSDDLVNEGLDSAGDENILSDLNHSIDREEDIEKWRHLLHIAMMRARTAREEGYFWVHKRLRGKESRPYPRVPLPKILSFEPPQTIAEGPRPVQSMLGRILALGTLLGISLKLGTSRLKQRRKK